MTKRVTIEATNISPKQWSTLLLELDLITQQWKPFATLKLKTEGLSKVIAWGTKTGKESEQEQK